MGHPAGRGVARFLRPTAPCRALAASTRPVPHIRLIHSILRRNSATIFGSCRRRQRECRCRCRLCPSPADFEVYGFPVASPKQPCLSPYSDHKKPASPLISELAGSLYPVPVLRRRVTVQCCGYRHLSMVVVHSAMPSAVSSARRRLPPTGESPGLVHPIGWLLPRRRRPSTARSGRIGYRQQKH